MRETAAYMTQKIREILIKFLCIFLMVKMKRIIWIG